MKTSEIIKTIRLELGLSQGQLARKVGVTRDIIANYETQRSIPPGDVMLEIIQFKYYLVPKWNVESVYKMCIENQVKSHII